MTTVVSRRKSDDFARALCEAAGIPFSNLFRLVLTLSVDEATTLQATYFASDLPATIDGYRVDSVELKRVEEDNAEE